MAGEQHLHAETHILPIRDHLDMQCAQFLASSLRETHLSHQYVTLPPGPRSGARVPTLYSRYKEQISHLLTNGVTPLTNTPASSRTSIRPPWRTTEGTSNQTGFSRRPLRTWTGARFGSLGTIVQLYHSFVRATALSSGTTSAELGDLTGTRARSVREGYIM